jgi:Cu(I)/Ag(I) efflux system membrane protein CusA/SilA
MNVSMTIEGLKLYPINFRYSRDLHDNINALQRVLIVTPRGEQITMEQVAKINIKTGPPAIKTENSHLKAWVYIDLKDIDVGTNVENSKKLLESQLQLPVGYSLAWRGQYEYMERSKEKLKLVVPLTFFLIFLLLYF